MNLLYIEGSSVDIDLTRGAFARLAPDIKMTVATTLSEGLFLLDNTLNLDAVLIDLHLPDGSWFDAIRHIRGHALPLAVILLTYPGGQESTIDVIQCGADDYLAKRDGYLDRLPDTIRRALSRFRDLSTLNNQIFRILFIEPIQSKQLMIKNYLVQHLPSIRISTVANAGEALARLPNSSIEASNFDVVFTNYHLPDMDGLEFIRIVRQERGLELPIVLITSQESEELAAQAFRLGVDNYLTKRPGFLNDLAATLERVKRQADLEHERASLKETNDRLNHFIANSPSILFCLHVNEGSVFPIWISQNIQSVLGYTQSEILSQNWWQHPHPDDRPQVEAAFARIVKEGSLTHDYRNQHRDGRTIWVREALRLVTDTQGKPSEVIGTWLDQSMSKRAETVQMARNEVFDQIVRNQKLPSILEGIALRLEKINPAMRVSILLLDRRKGKLFIGAAPSIPAFYNTRMDGLEPGLGRGSCGKAALLGETVIVPDIDNHPDWEPYLELTQKAGFHACWSAPFKDEDGKILGTFGIYYSQKRAPTPEDLSLIDEFAGITALAVQKVHSTDALQLSAAVFESTRDGVIITDLATRIISINRAYTEITGYSESEVLGCNPNIVSSGRHDANFFKAMWASINETGHWRGEIWNRRKNGEIYPQWLTVSTVLDEMGKVKNYVGVFTDISQVKQSEAQLEYLTHHDPLTHLPNRLLIQSRLEQAIERAERHNYRIAALYIDLDRFKTVNDSLGHPVGDELLIALTGRLTAHIREDEILARLGGDEFLMVKEILPQPESAAIEALSLIDLLSKSFKLPSGHEVFVSISIGISLYPDDGKTVTELIQYADLAMHQAKQVGRNTYQFHTKALTFTASKRLAVETNLRRALERNEFTLLYQPIINAIDGTVIAVETLLRWQSSDQFLELPDKFIEIAEETGLIVPIGEWVLRTACAQAYTWMNTGLPPLVMAVNISGRQFQSGKIVPLINSILQESGLPAHLLELELTESIVMDQAEQAIDTLNELKAMGVRLAIDDFGTGYSSLAYLSRFPIDKLKIDKSFVMDITENTNNSKIVSAIIAMAKSLKLEVLAEGLETKRQLEILRLHGCDQYQGFLFSKPLRENEIEQLLLYHQKNLNPFQMK